MILLVEDKYLNRERKFNNRCILYKKTKSEEQQINYSKQGTETQKPSFQLQQFHFSGKKKEFVVMQEFKEGSIHTINIRKVLGKKCSNQQIKIPFFFFFKKSRQYDKDNKN